MLISSELCFFFTDSFSTTETSIQFTSSATDRGAVAWRWKQLCRTNIDSNFDVTKSHFRMMAESCDRMNQRDDEDWELTQALWGEEYFEARRSRGNATRKKGIGTAYHIIDAKELGGCAEFSGIEIQLALTNASGIFRRARTFRGCRVLFSGDANERTVEQKKQAEVPSDATLGWRRALGTRAAPHQTGQVSLSICRLADTRRAESGRQQACAGAVVHAPDESAMETCEAGFMQKRKQFERRAALT
jgi:hypothetical protein